VERNNKNLLLKKKETEAPLDVVGEMGRGYL